MADDNGTPAWVTMDVNPELGFSHEALVEAQINYSGMRREIEDLRQTVGAQRERIDALLARRDTLQADLVRIATDVREQAESRDWCSEYDDFVSSVNDDCSEPWLQFMRRTETYAFHVAVTVTANSSDAENAKNELTSYLELLSDALSHGEVDELIVTPR